MVDKLVRSGHIAAKNVIQVWSRHNCPAKSCQNVDGLPKTAYTYTPAVSVAPAEQGLHG